MKHAFPKVAAVDSFGNQLSVDRPGMTLREYYAGQALAGIMSNTTISIDHLDRMVYMTARVSKQLADALIAELKKEEGK